MNTAGCADADASAGRPQAAFVDSGGINKLSLPLAKPATAGDVGAASCTGGDDGLARLDHGDDRALDLELVVPTYNNGNDLAV